MIEQQQNRLTLTFPTEESATTFAAFLRSLFSPAALETSEPPFGLPPEPQPQTPDSLAPARSRRTVLTDDRLEQLSQQRAQGLTAHQRLLRAQATLRDGVLPFSKPGQVPAPTGQDSPRIRAQQEGGFADGQPGAHQSKLRPVDQTKP